MPPVDMSQTAYVRSVPILMAMALGFVALVATIVTSCMHAPPSFNAAAKEVPTPSWKDHPWTARIKGLIALIAAVLIAIAFAVTFQVYRSAIVHACTSVALQPVKCATMQPKIESILLPLALALFAVAALLFACVKPRVIIEEEEQRDHTHRHTTRTTMTSHPDTHHGASRRRSTLLLFGEKDKYKLKSDVAIDYHTDDTDSVDDALDPWRQAAQYDEQLAAFPLRPPPAANRLSGDERRHNASDMAKRRSQQTQSPRNSTQNAKYEQQRRSRDSQGNRRHSQPLAYQATRPNTHQNPSSEPYQPRRTSTPRLGQKTGPNDEEDDDDDDHPLVPPRLPFAAKRQKRPNSSASANTFGANEALNMAMDSPVSSSCDTLDSPRWRQASDASYRRSPTPTGSNTRNHGYFDSQQPRTTTQQRTGSHGSLCFTPTYHSSSSHGSLHAYPSPNPQGRRSPPAASSPSSSRRPSHPLAQPSSPIPTLQSPPSSRHPLSKKEIKDQRISAYLQQPS
ncbi:hypothetical protein BC940DRAFT_83463 [Gongronella butleri]|nr:hypothetical protein BC940DRAFT_83463 [Gongronella butleri]